MGIIESNVGNLTKYDAVERCRLDNSEKYEKKYKKINGNCLTLSCHCAFTQFLPHFMHLLHLNVDLHLHL